MSKFFILFTFMVFSAHALKSGETNYVLNYDMDGFFTIPFKGPVFREKIAENPSEQLEILSEINSSERRLNLVAVAKYYGNEIIRTGSTNILRNGQLLLSMHFTPSIDMTILDPHDKANRFYVFACYKGVKFILNKIKIKDNKTGFKLSKAVYQEIISEHGNDRRYYTGDFININPNTVDLICPKAGSEVSSQETKR